MPPSAKMQTRSPFDQRPLWRLERLDQRLGAVGIADGNHAPHRRQPVDPPAGHVIGPGQHPDGAGGNQQQQDAVEPRDVIGDEQGTARLRQVFQSPHPNAVKNLADNPDDAADGRLRNEANDVDGNGNRSQSGRQEDRAGIQWNCVCISQNSPAATSMQRVRNEVVGGQDRCRGRDRRCSAGDRPPREYRTGPAEIPSRNSQTHDQPNACCARP